MNNKIDEKVRKIKEYDNSINVIIDTINELKEKGGRAKLTVNTKSNKNGCEVFLDSSDGGIIVDYLVMLCIMYNNRIRELQKEINECIDRRLECMLYDKII